MPEIPSLPRVLLVVGVGLLVLSALFPAQPYAYHLTHPGTASNASQLAADGFTVVHYDDLSDRGQELYVQTLERGGRYAVPARQGAPKFPYPTVGELEDESEPWARMRLGSVVVERPPDADLPPAHEPVHEARRPEPRRGDTSGESGGEGTAVQGTDEQVDDRPDDRPDPETIRRFDLVTTRTGTAPLTALPSLLRLLSVVVGVVAIGTAGYLAAQPRR
jgi:hypothetical protein